MYPIEFKQANRKLTRPPSMTDEECGSLHVYADGERLVSLWKMSWCERFSALFFGRLWLYVFSDNTQPPVALSVEKDVFFVKPQ